MILIDVIKLSEQRCKYALKAELKYATSDNIVGRCINGYHEQAVDFALLTPLAAERLCEVQDYLITKYNYGLLIYDAYRPKRAVLDFLDWALQEANNTDQQKRPTYYPKLRKDQLFPLGYFAEDSGHCYGNTVDLVLFDFASNQTVDMGACFDHMDEISSVAADVSIIGDYAHKHRNILTEAMVEFDFESYHQEFWHFSHGGFEGREVVDPLDIPITPDLKGAGIR
ncbi:D-alanyl-D-alanine dipeptidase [soil metagenome]